MLQQNLFTPFRNISRQLNGIGILHIPLLYALELYFVTPDMLAEVAHLLFLLKRFISTTTSISLGVQLYTTSFKYKVY